MQSDFYSATQKITATFLRFLPRISGNENEETLRFWFRDPKKTLWLFCDFRRDFLAIFLRSLRQSLRLVSVGFGSTDFSRFLLLIFVGKSAQKNPPGNPWQNPLKFAPQKSPTHFCQGAGLWFCILRFVKVLKAQLYDCDLLGCYQEVPDYGFVCDSKWWKSQFSVDAQLRAQLTRQLPPSSSKENFFVWVHFGGVPGTVEKVVWVRVCCLRSWKTLIGVCPPVLQKLVLGVPFLHGW